MHTLSTTLAAAPHRLLFLAGTAQAVLTLVWWLVMLAGRLDGSLVQAEPAIAASASHAWLMLYGLFPFFIFGFLFTALPNWLETPATARRGYLATGLPMALGAALFYPGLYWPALAFVAVLIHLFGWGLGLATLLASLRASGMADRRHGWAVWGAMAMGWLGAASFAIWLVVDAAWQLDLAIQLALWGFLTPLFLTVCHRMIPFFTSRVIANYVMIRPYGALWLMLAASLGHGALVVAGLMQWTWLADLPLAALALWFTARWGIARTFDVRLLAMLHIAFVWATLAFILFAADSLIGPGLGLAPLHALGIGFFSSMLIGMASRVSLGHSGRKLEADNYTWALFWVVQCAALTRMLPDLLDAPYLLVALSAGLWLIAFVAWASRYGPYFWRPRSDGKPG